MAKKTPLYDKHVTHQAKMIDFGGWLMPLHYGSQRQEHHQVRQDAGMFDVSHMVVIDLTGQHVQAFLRYLLANDVAKLKKKGKALYSCMLNEKGGVIDDLIVYYQSDTQYRIVSNAATHDRDIAWIQQHAEKFEVTITERSDLAILAVQGPHARDKVKTILSPSLQKSAMALKPFFACWDDDMFIARTGYTGEDGFELIVSNDKVVALWDKLLAADIVPIGLGARDSLRLEAGMNLQGQDMSEAYTPLMANLTWTVAFSPEDRDFIGRDALVAQQKAGDYPILVGLVLKDKGVLRVHQKVYADNGEEGEITSGTFSPTLNASIGFARLPADVYEQVMVEIRNKRLPAQVVKPPFVRQGKICIEL